ncbi:MAG: hypothetical protein JST54_32715 [Deltaproteobacteria bacterium]|nr:hypothetical protein [Deltaproteobacteria bacterium]
MGPRVSALLVATLGTLAFAVAVAAPEAPLPRPTAADLAGDFEVVGLEGSAYVATNQTVSVVGNRRGARLDRLGMSGQNRTDYSFHEEHLDADAVKSFLESFDALKPWSLRDERNPRAMSVTGFLVELRRGKLFHAFTLGGGCNCAPAFGDAPPPPCPCPQKDVITLLTGLQGEPVQLSKPEEKPFTPHLPKGAAVPGTCTRHDGIIECGHTRCFEVDGDLACYASPTATAKARVHPKWAADTSPPPKGQPMPLFWALELADGQSCQAFLLKPGNRLFKCEAGESVRDLFRAGDGWVAVFVDANAAPRAVPVKAVWR